MVKINDTTAFPNTAPALTDHWPGTDVSDVAADPEGKSVTFTFQGALTLFNANASITESQISDLGAYQAQLLEGAFVDGDKTKLNGIATGATVNATDAALRDRTTHTGTQAAGTITGLATVATSGGYADLTGLPTLFDGVYTSLTSIPATFAPSTHTHPQSEVTSLVTDLGNKQPLATVLTNTTAAFTTAQETKLSGIATGAEVNTIESDITGITGADQVTNVVSLTQAEYDAIGTPNASTFYVITA